MSLKVSIVMPVYNSERFLQPALGSILRQSLEDFELLCVDDCSNDNSAAVLEEYAARDSRIRILRTPGQSGPGPARNLGFKAAQGEFIAVCDADDRLPQRSLEARYAAAVKHGAQIAAGNMVITDPTGEYYLPPPLNQGGCGIQDSECGAPANLAPLWIPYHHYRFLFRRDFLLDNGLLYAGRLRGEDPLFLAQVLCKAKTAALCPETVYSYRISAGAKIDTDKKLDDYLGHIPLTMGIFEQAGQHRLAMLYLYFQAAEFSGLQSFRWYPRPFLRRILSAFQGWFEEYGPAGDSAGGQAEELDFRPYKIDPTALRAEFALMRRGLLGYAAGKGLRRLRGMA